MKKMILTIGVLFIIQSIFCQAESMGDWMISVNAGIEGHDKRLFDFPDKELLLSSQPEFWGTYRMRLSIRRKVWQSKRFGSFLGLGAGYEKATFLRPFNKRYFERGLEPDILLNLNIYEKVQAPLSLLNFLKLGDQWLISGEIISNFLLFRRIDHTENLILFPYTQSTFELDDIQFRLGINFRLGNLMIGVNSRLVNFQKIDKIIFNDIVKDPRIDQKWEWHNPLRFDLTVGYTW